MLAVKRLKAEYANLHKDPLELAIARPRETDLYEWHFLLKGVDVYEGGYYHGMLKFPPK
jgi:ubiquitin-conjugating enzyme E2 J2